MKNKTPRVRGLCACIYPVWGGSVPLSFLAHRRGFRARGHPVRSLSIGQTCVTSASPSAGRFAALAADFGHMSAIPADGFATLAAGDTGFVGIKLVSGSLLMCGPTALTCDLALPFRIHARKS